MDPEQLADARAQLERDFLADAISAEEYTRLRRQLHEGGSIQESVHEIVEAQEQVQAPEQEIVPARVASDSLDGAQRAAPAGDDPVTGAHLASWGRRAAAWFVDLMVIGFALWAASAALAFTTEDSGTETITVAVLLLGPPLYQWLMIGWSGQTLGKAVLGIRVARSEDAAGVSYPRALGRALSLWVFWTFGWLLLGLPLLLAYLWPLWNRRNQTLYDKMAGTIVVEGS
ncbi:MAG: RDD family protein [Gaiellaceae bacterium]